MRQMAGARRPRDARLLVPWDRPVFGESLGHGRRVIETRRPAPDPPHRVLVPRVRSLCVRSLCVRSLCARCLRV
jgi:hypothetical protein